MDNVQRAGLRLGAQLDARVGTDFRVAPDVDVVLVEVTAPDAMTIDLDGLIGYQPPNGRLNARAARTTAAANSG